MIKMTAGPLADKDGARRFELVPYSKSHTPRNWALHLIVATAVAVLPSFGSAVAMPADCVNIYQDEAAPGKGGSINAIFLANLLGHWPKYEVRVAHIGEYKANDIEACKASFYLGTSNETKVPTAFLDDFFKTEKSVAWVGFGVGQLNADKFKNSFHLRVGEQLSDDGSERYPGFHQFVKYKGSTFIKKVIGTDEGYEGAFDIENFLEVDGLASRDFVLAEIVHNKTHEGKPYFLRSVNKFVIGDIPFSYMHEGDRYFAFADLLFDILDEPARRPNKLAFVRLEDIHALYERELLDAAFKTLRENEVPISIAHIPVFADPFNAVGLGATKAPKPGNEVPSFAKLVQELKTDDRNAVIWHGTTHQYEREKNPSGASGDDYEFWNAVNNRPIKGETPKSVTQRLKKGLAVFDAYGIPPRYWVTPHNQASALDNVIFGKTFPWTVGRVTYYSSSVGSSFVLKPTTEDAGLNKAAVTTDQLDAAAAGTPSTDVDNKSTNGEGQLFPYEIYRDIYGQMIIPETINYLSLQQEDVPDADDVRDVNDMLADAKRNLVVRDYWASAFIHPYLFNTEENGGGGKFVGDTTKLKELLTGLKRLGYTFVGLKEFEDSTVSRVTRESRVTE
jgi:uncharacterized protein YdaL